MANPAGYNTPNVQKPDGTWEINGVLDVITANGGILKIDGTDVSAGLEEIANLTGLDSGELAVLNGVTAGTVTASKALVVDANSQLDALGITTQTVRVHNATGGTLAKGDIVSFVGVHTNGLPKAVKADANNGLLAHGAIQADILTTAAGNAIVRGLSPATLNTDAFSAIDDPVYLSETAGAVATAAETESDEFSQVIGYVAVKSATVGQLLYNFADTSKIGNPQLQTGTALANLGTTATVLEMDELDDISSLAQSTIAVAAEGSDSIDVTVTLKDAAGAAVDEARPVECWLSDSATTGAIYTDGGITVTASTGSILKEHTDDLIFKAVTSTAGVLVLNVAGSGDQAACYLWVAFPNGKCKVSAVIDLAA